MRITLKLARELGIDAKGPHGRGKRPPKTKGKGKPHKGPTPAQKAFRALCQAHGLPEPVEEYPFAKEALGRDWRFDWLFEGWLALEVQGGLFVEGRHARGAALLKEHEKLNAAVLLGYSVLFCTPKDIDSGAIFPTVKKVLEAREEQA